MKQTSKAEATGISIFKRAITDDLNSDMSMVKDVVEIQPVIFSNMPLINEHLGFYKSDGATGSYEPPQSQRSRQLYSTRVVAIT
eukprot:1184420-Prorocentrum_minimum.AAC.1